MTAQKQKIGHVASFPDGYYVQFCEGFGHPEGTFDNKFSRLADALGAPRAPTNRCIDLEINELELDKVHAFRRTYWVFYGEKKDG